MSKDGDQANAIGSITPCLDVRIGERRLFTYLLTTDRLVIGRSDACDLALPSAEISRTHAVLERRRDGWWIRDRSKHGINVNGSATTRCEMKDGDVIGFGRYTARFHSVAPGSQVGVETAPALPGVGAPCDVIEVDRQGCTAIRACLRVVAGPRSGQSYPLNRSRMRLGGPGADIAVDRELPRDAVHIRVVRGRVMIEPGQAPARLAGQLVDEVTPALHGERLDVRGHSFVVTVEAVRESTHLDSFAGMVGASEPMRALFGILERLTRSDYPVLLLGESGTGKELAARGLHAQSRRRTGPFIAVNCAAITSTLFESELFGHEKGAFTGAVGARDGAFQRADGGVLFLDEIGELGLDEQAKLLRVLEPGGGVRRVGARRDTFPNVRIVAATNRNLPVMVARGQFRSDLYHRLTVLTAELPALRDRREDIVPLAEALLARRHPAAVLDDGARLVLTEYPWPGNVRELANVLTRAVVLGGGVVTPSNLAFYPDSFPATSESLGSTGFDTSDLERAQLVAALEAANGNKAEAARALGMPRSSLIYKLRRLGIDQR